MNSRGNKVILILVVGLAAFTSAMKELNEVRKFGLEASEFVAQWSEKLTPVEVPPVPVVAKLETCHSKQSQPIVELPWLENVGPSKVDIVKDKVKVKKLRRVDVDPAQFEVRIMNDTGRDDDQDVPAVYEFPLPSSTFKFKSRKHSSIRFNFRDREILKTLNRSINLRSAS